MNQSHHPSCGFDETFSIETPSIVNENKDVLMEGCQQSGEIDCVQETVLISCSDLKEGNHFTYRYLFLTGSILWISKSVVEVSSNMKSDAKLRTTVRQVYLMIRISDESLLNVSDNNRKNNDHESFQLRCTGTLVKRRYSKTSFAISFSEFSDCERWMKILEKAKQDMPLQHANGTYKYLLGIAARMQHSLSIVDRYYHLKKYKKCFLGSEAVLWLIKNQGCSPESAVALGNRMIDLNIFEHVACEHFLCDAYLFYRFTDDALAQWQEGTQVKVGDRHARREGTQDEAPELQEHELPLLLQAIEDLEEEENIRLRDKLNAVTFQLESTTQALYQLENGIIYILRLVAAFLCLVIVRVCLHLFFVSDSDVEKKQIIFSLSAVLVVSAEYYHEALSTLLYNIGSCGMSCIVKLNCDKEAVTSALSLPSTKLRMKLMEHESLKSERKNRREIILCENSLSAQGGVRDNVVKVETYAKRDLQGDENMIMSKEDKKDSGSQSSTSCALSGTLRLPPYSEWPNYPLLVRRSPDMFNVFPSILDDDESNTDVQLINDDVYNKESLEQLIIPLHIHQQPPESSIFPVDNHLFKGRVFVILVGLDDSPDEYFTSRSRLFQVIVQGQFKQVTPYSSVYTGQIFRKTFDSLPPKWLIRVLLGLLSKIQPGLEVCLEGPTPYLVSPLIASSKNVVVSMPGAEPDICVTKEGGANNVLEDMRLLIAHAHSAAANSIFESRSASKRAAFFSDTKNLSKFDFNPQLIYTFDFYQHVLNIGQLKLDLGFTSVDISKIIGFSPVQIMAAEWHAFNKPTDTDSINYFYNIEMWHHKSFPDDFFSS